MMSAHGTAGLLAIAMLAAVPAMSQPRIPAADEEVVERLRVDPVAREIAARRAHLQRAPRDVEAAARLAELHIARARSESDPRHLGRAQAALSPWWGIAEPPTRVLVLRALVRQSGHDFSGALADLALVTAREPANAQGWLTRASVEQVIADFGAARASCHRLQPIAAPIVTAACLAAVEGATGNAASALERLMLLGDPRTRSPAVLSWAAALKAELAERIDREAEAEAFHRQAIAFDSEDAYARAAYADFLLDRGRAREVVELIGPDSRSDALLLRYAIAARTAAASQAGAATARLGERFAASRARGDRVHLREEARYALELLGDPRQALALARRNWAIQKEPADARIVLEAALAAGDREAAREVLDWLAHTRLEGRRMAELAARLERR